MCSIRFDRRSHSRMMLACAILACLAASARSALAQIYTWNTNELIPGTEGITLGPGVDLSGWNTPGHQLEFANFNTNASLTNASFNSSDLVNATFYGTSLINAGFSGTVITGADFSYTSGFTASQLYSTASYASGNLTGIGLQLVDSRRPGWEARR